MPSRNVNYGVIKRSVICQGTKQTQLIDLCITIDIDVWQDLGTIHDGTNDNINKVIERTSSMDE